MSRGGFLEGLQLMEIVNLPFLSSDLSLNTLFLLHNGPFLLLDFHRKHLNFFVKFGPNSFAFVGILS